MWLTESRCVCIDVQGMQNFTKEVSVIIQGMFHWTQKGFLLLVNYTTQVFGFLFFFSVSEIIVMNCYCIDVQIFFSNQYGRLK